MDTKVCTKCGGIFPATEEYFYWYRATGRLRNWCRGCCRANLQKNRKLKPDRYRKMDRDWCRANPDKRAAIDRKWRENNPAACDAGRKRWRAANPEKVLAGKRKERQKNRAKYHARTKRAYHTRPWVKAAMLHRNKIILALKWRGLGATDKQIHGLGIPANQYVRWLEDQFSPGMTWDNWGIHSPTELRWNVDHILPLRGKVAGELLFDLSVMAEQAVAFNYLNTRPMWAGPNIVKSNRVPHWDDIPAELQAICTPRIRALLQKVKKTA